MRSSTVRFTLDKRLSYYITFLAHNVFFLYFVKFKSYSPKTLFRSTIVYYYNLIF